MRLLDLFCGAGGSAVGYHQAGFDEIVGVDIRPQQHYPFTFVLGDALFPPLDMSTFDLIHASPPCQAYSSSTPDPTRHPRLINPTRELMDSGRPWIIENVPGSWIRGDYMLCGSMFGLASSTGLQLRRHRYFEVSWIPNALGPVCAHTPGRTISVVGDGTTSGNRKTLGRNVSITERREAMGIDWSDRRGLSEAVPPAYTRYLGEQFLDQLARTA